MPETTTSSSTSFGFAFGSSAARAGLFCPNRAMATAVPTNVDLWILIGSFPPGSLLAACWRIVGATTQCLGLQDQLRANIVSVVTKCYPCLVPFTQQPSGSLYNKRLRPYQLRCA